ncbi:MAG: hypothetical protein CMG50_02390 [Candidatus Marinimicrobia bacterium]|nr:hypothetical protein [Candidatus Neomarinimicrobiota bacterium]
MKNLKYLYLLLILIFTNCENNPTIYTDCQGITNGLSIEDNCGICDNDPTNDCTLDCNNTWGGTSEYDGCGICGGSGKLNCDNECVNPNENGNYIDNSMDCFGDCNGDAIIDECNICNGPGAVYLCGCNGLENGKCDCFGNELDCSNECGGTALLDCNNECGGTSIIDECGECGGTGAEENFNCDGICIAQGNNLDNDGYDESGVCGGDNSTCSNEFNGCLLPINYIYSLNGTVYYNVDFNISGFQWTIEGANSSGASGGDAASAGFFVQTGNNTVIGFSFTGGTVSSGCGILTNLILDSEPTQFIEIEFEDDTNNPFFQPTVNYYQE